MLLDEWLFLAPMTTVPKYVLDIATGTGIWAHDFGKFRSPSPGARLLNECLYRLAEKYPAAFVIGTDLSAIQPDPLLPNLVFQKDDAESPWVFPAPHPPGAECEFPCEHKIVFDYVHLRQVVTCFSDPRIVMQQAFDNMNPGGWIEFQDMTFGLHAEPSKGLWQVHRSAL